jgi:hypothetical protein
MMFKSTKIKKTKTGSFDSVVQSLEVITDVESSLTDALDAIRTDEKENRDLLNMWSERKIKASAMLKRAKTPEGIEAMEVLSAKASNFEEFYQQTGERIAVSLAEVNDSMEKVKLAKNHLTAVEKTQALDVTLRKMASESNIVITSTPTLDHREISRVIHTAKALAELKSIR